METSTEFTWIKRPDGTSEFMDFMNSLPSKDRAKLATLIEDVEVFGIREAFHQQWVKKLRDGICELRSKHGSNIQRALYFHEVGNRYVITHGFTKKTDKTPEREIEHALRMMNDYLARN